MIRNTPYQSDRGADGLWSFCGEDKVAFRLWNESYSSSLQKIWRVDGKAAQRASAMAVAVINVLKKVSNAMLYMAG